MITFPVRNKKEAHQTSIKNTNKPYSHVHLKHTYNTNDNIYLVGLAKNSASHAVQVNDLYRTAVQIISYSLFHTGDCWRCNNTRSDTSDNQTEICSRAVSHHSNIAITCSLLRALLWHKHLPCIFWQWILKRSVTGDGSRAEELREL